MTPTGLLEAGGVVGGESERAESELVAHDQTAVRNHVDEDRRKMQPCWKSLRRFAPWWVPTVVVLSLKVRIGGTYEEARP